MDLVFLVPVTFLAAVAFIVKWSLEHARWKQQHARSSSSEGKSLSVSELHSLIHDAVAEATAPLAERIAALEQHAAAAPLPAPTDLLDAAEGYVAEAPLNTPHGQPVR